MQLVLDWVARADADFGEFIIAHAGVTRLGAALPDSPVEQCPLTQSQILVLAALLEDEKVLPHALTDYLLGLGTSTPPPWKRRRGRRSGCGSPRGRTLSPPPS